MILAAIKSAILRLTGTTVSEVFSSSSQIAVEMADLANEVAADIAEFHDWRALTRVHQVVATGATAYDLPSDYDRMIASAEVDDATNWAWGYFAFSDINEWMRHTTGGTGFVSPGGWIITGGQLQFHPAPTGTAQFPYISKNWAMSDGSVAKAAFDSDSDSFVLDERLLTLGLIWKWQEQKGLEYSESMRTYEIALSRAASRDGGAKVLRPTTRVFRNAGIAYSARPFR